MFDLGWDEMAVIAVVALIVLGPKELPNALRTMSMVMKNARKLASEFQSGVNEIIREADLEDARKKLNEIQSLNKDQIQDAIQKAVDPSGEVKAALNVDPNAPEPVKPPEIGSAAIGSTGIASPDVMSEGENHAVETAAAEPVMVPLPSTNHAGSQPAHGSSGETSRPDLPETSAAEKS